MLDLVEMRTAGFPISGVSLERHANAGLIGFEFVAAGSVAGVPVDLAVARGADHQVIIGAEDREIRAALLERDDDGVLAVGLDVDDRVDEALGCRF